MFIIDVTLKSTPITLSVQRKTSEDAEASYHQVIEAMKSGEQRLIELVCEHQTGKKISIVSSEITAVQLYEKSGTATASGKAPGFSFAAAG